MLDFKGFRRFEKSLIYKDSVKIGRKYLDFWSSILSSWILVNPTCLIGLKQRKTTFFMLTYVDLCCFCVEC